MPKGFIMSKLRAFDGMGDPSNHLKAYDLQFSFWASEDDVYARAFPGSLSGTALKCFHKLPPNSINCWQDTVDLFIDKFGASIVAEEDEEALMNLKQKSGETLRSYAKCFQRVLNNIGVHDFVHPWIAIRATEREASTGASIQRIPTIPINSEVHKTGGG
ncbi:hypothetical protein LIER_18524 [Lithospermum erythrorhizon]|uniref:Retrotransposon gag domain-containing protein n=1 Tax=Lithospermum erythrorhizon TaxID=34254 RepID=A0AAV3QGW2_LITER